MNTAPGRDVQSDPAATYDVIVLGSGGAALAAAFTAANEGLATLVLERANVLGGTSAISGGALWIPGTRQAIAGGYQDSADNVRLYLKNLLGNHYNKELIEAFIARGPEALAYLEDNAEIKYSVRELSPDYYTHVAGSTDNGRALEVAEYDGRKLGDYFELLRPPLNGLVLFGGLMLNRQDIYNFLRIKKSFRSFLYCALLLLRFARDRLSYSRGTRLVIGSAMMAGLIRSCLGKGVKFQIGAETLKFLTAPGGRVNGVTAQLPDGRVVNITTRRGVVLGTGGISRNPNVDQDRPDTRADHISAAAPHANGAMIRLAEDLGARVGTDMISNFYWAPMSQMTLGGGKSEIFPHIVTDRAKPGIIAITEKAQRFTNEAHSYHRFVTAMREQQRNGIHRFYLMADKTAVRAYGLGLARPDPGNNAALVANGYLMQADTVAELARRMTIDPAALEATIAVYNRDATAGRDPQFHKGGDSYNSYMGDASAAYPCLAPIVTPPFYAVQLHTGDLGSAKGLITDGNARVLRGDGTPIAGLFAVGSDMNSMFAGEYPGPGITLGPGLTFGYVAAKTMADETPNAVSDAAG